MVFFLKDNDVIVGVHCAIYSVQIVHGLTREFCNLATWFVLREYRSYSLKLMSSVLKQKELIFTSHSIQTDLVPLHKKLGFVRYKNVKLIFIPHYPTFSWLFSKIRYHVDIGLIKDELDYNITSVSDSYFGLDRIKQALFEINGKYCLLLYKKICIYKIPCAHVIYVSNPEFYDKYVSLISWYFFRHQKLLFTRVLSSHLIGIPWFAIKVKNKANMMYKNIGGESLNVKEIYTESIFLK